MAKKPTSIPAMISFLVCAWSFIRLEITADKISPTRIRKTVCGFFAKICISKAKVNKPLQAAVCMLNFKNKLTKNNSTTPKNIPNKKTCIHAGAAKLL